MADSIPNSLNSPTVNRLLTILKPLLLSTSGTAVFQHCSLLLESLRNQSVETQNAYTDLLRELLNIIDCYTPSNSPLQPHLQLLRQHLASPLTANEINQLRKTIHDITLQANIQPPTSSNDQPSAPLDALATHYNTISSSADNSTAAATAPLEAQAPTSNTGRRHEGDSSLQVGQVYRRHLDDKRQRIQRIQKTLGEQVDAVIKQSEEFGVLLEVEYETLTHSQNITDVHELRQTLLVEVEKLLRGNHSLASKLDKAKNYLKIIESEGQHLNDELTRVHILSLTDDLTGLSNRRAFVRHLEDETSRVKRYGSPLSLALIDLDFFKRINDKLGHPAGDEVLRTFSNNILSIFRHHDMVSRYGGEEFAILLPNTDIKGAYRALEKVKARATKTYFHHNDITHPMPTFSAGIALYRPGESPGDLIERADKALFRAKDLGRNRIEISQADRATKDQELRNL